AWPPTPNSAWSRRPDRARWLGGSMAGWVDGWVGRWPGGLTRRLLHAPRRAGPARAGPARAASNVWLWSPNSPFGDHNPTFAPLRGSEPGGPWPRLTRRASPDR